MDDYNGLKAWAKIDWDRAACKETEGDLFTHSERFFPKRRQSPDPAIAYCADCPIIRDCLLYAIEHESWGVWGGTSDAERKKLRSAIRKARKAHEALDSAFPNTFNGLRVGQS